MRSGAERLRAGLLLGAVVVLGVVGTFLVGARWRAHRLLRELPERLGAEIQKETNGFTYSQSLGGRTVFTIHAARATQRKDGQALLHDVGIVLYGKDGRADRIQGKDFDYDQAKGIVRAEGEVELDLQAPAPASARERAAFAKGQAPVAGGGEDGQTIHVVTSGLVYAQRLGVASTEAPIRFSVGGLTGQAVGASFSTDTGRMVLEHDVRVSGIAQGRPALLTAAHAELDRSGHAVQMQAAQYVTFSGGPASEERMARAERVTLHLREDGSVADATGEGGVELKSGGAQVRSDRGEMQVSEEGKPRAVRMTGGVRFAEGEGAPNSGEGSAGEGLARLGEAGALQEVRLLNGVTLHMGESSDGRQLTAGEVLLHFAGERKPVLKWADATEDAQLTQTRGSVRQEIAGPHLLTTFGVDARGRAVPSELTGEGGVTLHRLGDGVDERSRSQRVKASFGQVRGGAALKQTGSVGLVSAVQQGQVAVERRSTGRGGTVEVVRARGDELMYEAMGRREVLRGGVELSDADGLLRAQQVTFDEETQRAEAVGGVQLSYTGSDTQVAGRERAPQTVHAVGERGVFDRASSTAEIYGVPGTPARVWQEGSSVEAPVLVLHEASGVVEAHGTRAGSPGAVRSVFATEGQGGGQAGPARPRLLRVASSTLRYERDTRQATFAGGVELQAGDDVVESRTAVATLQPTAASTSGKTAAGRSEPAAGGLERVLATGDVTVRQPPGRVATGAQALYEAASGEVVLTGTAGRPPQVRDPEQGELTGEQIRFRVGDNGFVVDGTQTKLPGSGTHRVHTRVREPEGSR